MPTSRPFRVIWIALSSAREARTSPRLPRHGWRKWFCQSPFAHVTDVAHLIQLGCFVACVLDANLGRALR